MLSELAYDEVESRKTHERATLPCEVGLPDLYWEGVYEENNFDGSLQKMPRSCIVFNSLYNAGFFVLLGRISIIRTSICYIF